MWLVTVVDGERQLESGLDLEIKLDDRSHVVISDGDDRLRD